MNSRKQTVAEQFEELHNRLKTRDSYHVNAAKFELSEQIFQAMEDKGVSGAELARRLGVSRAYVNKVLQGSANLTIESLVKIGRALDCEFKFEFVGKYKEASVDEAGIIDAEIVYIKEEPASEPKFVSQVSGYKQNGFYNFEDFNYKKLKDISIVEMSFI